MGAKRIFGMIEAILLHGLILRRYLGIILVLALAGWVEPVAAILQQKPQDHSIHHVAHHTVKYHTHHHHHPLTHASVQPALAMHIRGGTMTLGQSGVCSMAKSELGKPYVWGGDAPNDGFDCSGFSQYVYGQEGVKIPRTALQQYASLTPVHHLQDGDLVFFRTLGRRVSHVGIYLGNGYFIHSPRTGEHIRIDNLDEPYWRERYAGARRVLTNRA